MNLLMIQEPFEVWIQQAALLRIIDENIIRIDLLILELAIGTRLVHDGIDVGFLDGKDFSNSMMDFRIYSLQNHILPILHHRKEGASLNLHDIDHFRNNEIEDILHLNPFPSPQLQKDLFHNLVFRQIQLLEVQDPFLRNDITRPSRKNLSDFGFERGKFLILVFEVDLE